jgi:hypothetical protein
VCCCGAPAPARISRTVPARPTISVNVVAMEVPTPSATSPESTDGLQSQTESVTSETTTVFSDTTSISTTASSVSSTLDLPPSAYDGSHLHWKAFRQHVLGPHRIRVVENPPKEYLPTAFLSIIEARSKNVEQYEAQQTCFREQVNEGRGFGPSPLFPPNLLPSIDDQPHLARCMIPQFSRESLPERKKNQGGPLYELSVPRPGLGCGFSSLAFSNEDINVLPSFLVATGTSVDFSTGYISPSHAVYCPVLIFERAYGKKEHRLETANNQCAIGGAYCTRSLQTLYTKAYPKDRMPPRPVTFSCTVDNDFAIINLHWIDHDQVYLMAPLCRFDLRQDDHFRHFAAWIDAIGEWALTQVLPQVRAALKLLQGSGKPSPGLYQMQATEKLVLSTSECDRGNMLIKSLKTTFDNIPWRFEDDECTPVSSATASWGSPLVDDMIISNLHYPSIHRVQKQRSGEAAQFALNAVPDLRLAVSPAVKGNTSSPPPAYTFTPELVSQKRLDHAMEEIRDLHAQLEAMKKSNGSVDTQIAGLRETLGTILRKESTFARSRSLLARRVTLPAETVPSSPTDFDVGLPRSRSLPQIRSRSVDMLQIRTDLPLPPSRLKICTSATAGPTTSAAIGSESKTAGSPRKPAGPTLTLSCNGVDVLLSPTLVQRKLLPTPSFDSHKSPFSSRAPWPSSPRTPVTSVQVGSPGLPSPKHVTQNTETSRPKPTTLMALSSTPAFRLAATILTGYVLVTAVPREFIQCLVVGCAADYCLRSVARSYGDLSGVGNKRALV